MPPMHPVQPIPPLRPIVPIATVPPIGPMERMGPMQPMGPPPMQPMPARPMEPIRAIVSDIPIQQAQPPVPVVVPNQEREPGAAPTNIAALDGQDESVIKREQ